MVNSVESLLAVSSLSPLLVNPDELGIQNNDRLACNN